jgi:hypothetical protein
MKIFMVAATSTICALMILWVFTACSVDKRDARLKILEAAKTAAQQPQERHYFDSLETFNDSMALLNEYSRGYNAGLRYVLDKLSIEK